jgi:hypothetical protein
MAFIYQSTKRLPYRSSIVRDRYCGENLDGITMGLLCDCAKACAYVGVESVRIVVPIAMKNLWTFQLAQNIQGAALFENEVPERCS